MSVRKIKGRIFKLMHFRFHGKFILRSAEDIEWDRMAPVGCEFGSPDYERLMALDQRAYEVFGTMGLARAWLDRPLPEMGGKSPEELAHSHRGWSDVIAILDRMT